MKKLLFMGIAILLFSNINPISSVWAQAPNNTQLSILKAEYYINTDPGLGKGISISAEAIASGIFEFSTKDLLPGNHLIVIRSQYSDSSWNDAKGLVFSVSPPETISTVFTRAEYFFDDDPGIGLGIPFTIDNAKIDRISEAPVPIPPNLTLGKHKITIRVFDNFGGIQTYNQPINITEQFGAEANFAFDLQNVQSGQRALFNNLSKFDNKRKWIFGDGSIDTVAVNPTKNYSPGVYNACLVVNNTFGADTVCNTITANGIVGLVANAVSGQPFDFGMKALGFDVSDIETITVFADVILERQIFIGSKTEEVTNDFASINLPVINYFSTSNNLITVSVIGASSVRKIQSVRALQAIVRLKDGRLFSSSLGNIPFKEKGENGITTQLVGPSRILAGRPTPYRIAITNTGTTTRVGVGTKITLIGNLTGQITSPVSKNNVNPNIINITPICCFYENPLNQPSGGNSIQNTNLLIPILPTGETRFLDFIVFPELGGGEIAIDVIITPSIFPEPVEEEIKKRLPPKNRDGSDEEGNGGDDSGGSSPFNCGPTNGSTGSGPGRVPECIGCIKDFIDDFDDDFGNLGKAFSYVCNFIDEVTDFFKKKGINDPRPEPFFNLAWSIASELAKSDGREDVVEAFNAVDNLINLALDSRLCKSKPGVDCSDPVEDDKKLPVVASFDPNIKIGPGTEERPFIRNTQVFNYRIYFENDTSATAPAAEVFVTDTLDLSVFDINTLKFTEWGLGDSIYNFANQQSMVIDELDLRPTKNTILRVNALVDTNGIVRVKYTSLDPVTRDLNFEIEDGFLNPNITKPEGEGFIGFNIQLKPNLTNRTTIVNRADIIFDFNKPIITPDWVNRIDDEAPISSIAELPPVITDTTFVLNLVDMDTGSGAEFFDVFVAVNDSSFRFLTRSFSDTLRFTGSFGNRYRFFTQATDRVNFVESLKTEADASTELQMPTSVRNNFARTEAVRIFPNPFSSSSTLQFNLETRSTVSVVLYDLVGRKTRQVLNNTDFGAGTHQVSIEKGELPAGIYYLRMEVNGNAQTHKIIIQ